MTMLSQDPTYLAAGLGLLAGGLFIALRVTQQGRYLIWALVALVFMVAVFAIEHLWVTDAERIEQVVYQLRDAVQASDADGVLSYLTADAEFVQGEHAATSGTALRAYIHSVIPGAKFDFVRISHLRAEASPRSRRGSAEFRVIASGSMQSLNFGTANSDWSLGFEETSPGVWRVNRISPTHAPRELPRPASSGYSGSHRGGRRSRSGSASEIDY